MSSRCSVTAAPLAVALALGVSLCAIAQSPDAVPLDAFIIAHQDDWQLFMGDVASKGIRNGNRAVFIYLTAGDENRDSAYWEARERGALQSTRLAAGVQATDTAAIKCGSTVVLTHSIRRCTIANTVSYFMRLPDGGRGGAGFGQRAFQSLRKLRARGISAITGVDRSATYSGWNDLTATAREIVRNESPPRSLVTLHVNDPNVAVNPHDHSDHRMSGFVAGDLKKNAGWRLIYYVGYALAARPDNRSIAQVRQKTALFLAYDRELLLVNRAWSAYSEHPAFYSACMLRTYARKVTAR